MLTVIPCHSIEISEYANTNFTVYIYRYKMSTMSTSLLHCVHSQYMCTGGLKFPNPNCVC